MSNALAIAAVTAILKDLLNNTLVDHDLVSGTSSVTVSALPPDRIAPGPGDSVTNRLNLFLYQVSPNQGWRNAALPWRDARGERLTNPPLALDLYYLLSAYGANDLEAEILLGYGMHVLHETPVLPRDAIRRALAPEPPVSGGILPPALQTLSAADLAEQVEQIKISPHYLDTEEMSHIWSALQTHYRSSTAYHVSVVLIESRHATPPAPPVREQGYKVYAVPLRQPHIDRVHAQAGVDKPIDAGDRLVLAGQRLRGEMTQVRVGPGAPIDPDPADIRDTQITVPVPASLRAGVRSAQVIHWMNMGEPPQPHRFIESNVAAFVHHPSIAKEADGSYKIESGTLTWTEVGSPGSTHKVCSGPIAITLLPKVGKEQRVFLLMEEVGVPADRLPRAYSFAAQPWPPDADESDKIDFEMSAVAEGTYLIKVQVDGAESALEVADDGSVGPQEEFAE